MREFLKSIKHPLTIMYLFVLFFVIGWVQCIVKAVDSDWDFSSREAAYITGIAIPPVGGVIGWFNIED